MQFQHYDKIPDRTTTAERKGSFNSVSEASVRGGRGYGGGDTFIIVARKESEARGAGGPYWALPLPFPLSPSFR